MRKRLGDPQHPVGRLNDFCRIAKPCDDEAYGRSRGREFANYLDRVLTKAREASKLIIEKSPLVLL